MNKYLSFGARGYTCQLPRIDKGLQEMGWALSDSDPDFIFANDSGGYDEAIAAKKKYPKAQLILNVLDIPEHLTSRLSEIIKQYKTHLSQADKITCISKTVRTQIKKHLNLNSEVIYNPTKEITFLNKTKIIDVLMTGRLGDPNKRAILGYDYWKRQDCSFHIAGPERPGFGIYHGLVDDEKLNELYNQSKFVFALGKVEGIGLQIPEAILANAVPIALRDCPASVEFCPAEFLAEPNVESIEQRIKWCYLNQAKTQEILAEYREKYKLLHYKNIALNILSVHLL